MQLRLRHRTRALTLVETVVAVAVLALTTVVTTQSMLVINRNSALNRGKNMAKAFVLGKINEVASVAYNPTATTPIIPAILNVGTTNTSVNLGDASTQVGSMPATMTWVVANIGSTGVLSVNCKVTYTLMGRTQSYEVLTYRASD